MRPDRFELPLRIVVAEPFPGLALTLQQGASGKAALVPPVSVSPVSATFDLEVAVEGALPDGRPRFLGPFVQGPPAERFVYLCVSQEGGSPVGRIKVPLRGLGWSLIEGQRPGRRIEGRIAGRNAKGVPALATVPILAPGWTSG
jgi:hypothetical protein